LDDEQGQQNMVNVGRLMVDSMSHVSLVLFSRYNSLPFWGYDLFFEFFTTLSMMTVIIYRFLYKVFDQNFYFGNAHFVNTPSKKLIAVENSEFPSSVSIADWNFPPFFIAADTYAQWIMAFLGLIATILNVWAIFLLKRTLDSTNRAVVAAETANAVTARAFSDESRPVFIVEIDESSEKQWIEGNAKEELVFYIKNVGRGVGVMKRLCRYWEEVPHGQMPVPIESNRIPPMASVADNEIAIGAGTCSHKIKARIQKIRKFGEPALDSTNIQNDIFFLGFIEYVDLGGNSFISGFCFIGVSREPRMGLHIPWPKDGTASRYNYHRRI
jgi:hypothetical protein